MASMAYRLDENEGSLDRTVLLLDGIPSRSWWLDVYGASGDISYDRGQPRRELLDLDGDGRYEARKLWYASADGSVSQAYVETDLDGDGLYEYRESLGSPRMRSWDMDGDGAADMVVHEDPDGSILYSFRPSWISREPLLVRVREGRPVEFMRSGRSLALSRDSAPSLWWIGKKPFDLGVRPASEGVYAKGSQRYALIRIGGEYYAELLD